MMKISIIVPAFNEEKLLGRALRRIQAASASFRQVGWGVELMVCDNNSSDQTAAVARAQGATVIFEPINQISRARNAGAAAATGDWLLFIDADSFPSPELFQEVAEQIQNPHCLGGGATVQLDQAGGWASLFVHGWNWLSRCQKWMAGSFIFCRVDAFRELGGFSLELFVAEEIEFSRRLKGLARGRGQHLVILHRHPLLTSARKVQLYTLRDYWPLFGQFVRSRGQNLKDRAHCRPWYDGRR